MGTKYSTVSITGYNASPPADDGTQTASNQVNWAKHKDKLGDPLKTAVEAIDTALVAALNTDAVAKTDNYTVTAAENAKTIQVTTASAGVDIILLDAATAAAGFFTEIVNAADSTDSLTVKLATSTDLLQTVTDGSVTIPVDAAAVFKVNPGEDGYIIGSSRNINLSKTTTTTGLPAGIINPYAGATVPTGWLTCDGSAVSRTTYADLFTAIGTTWGSGDGSTTFNLPNFNGRTLIGDGTGDYSGTQTARTLADEGGTETHTLTTDEMPSHTHSYTSTDAAGGNGLVAGSNVGSGVTGSAGNDAAHNNMQPYAVVKYIISI